MENHKISTHPQHKRKLESQDSKDVLINNLKQKLSKELKDHKESEKQMKSLQSECKACEQELKESQEEKKRLKIRARDLQEIVELTKETVVENETSSASRHPKNKEVILGLECEYPFKTRIEMNNHIENQSEGDSLCCLCSQILNSNTELTNHIRTRHTKEFNCTECDFQATSVIILNKHLNLKH